MIGLRIGVKNHDDDRKRPRKRPPPSPQHVSTTSTQPTTQNSYLDASNDHRNTSSNSSPKYVFFSPSFLYSINYIKQVVHTTTTRDMEKAQEMDDGVDRLLGPK